MLDELQISPAQTPAKSATTPAPTQASAPVANATSAPTPKPAPPPPPTNPNATALLATLQLQGASLWWATWLCPKESFRNWICLEDLLGHPMSAKPFYRIFGLLQDFSVHFWVAKVFACEGWAKVYLISRAGTNLGESIEMLLVSKSGLLNQMCGQWYYWFKIAVMANMVTSVPAMFLCRPWTNAYSQVLVNTLSQTLTTVQTSGINILNVTQASILLICHILL